MLRNRLRLLWEQHVYWARMVITGIAFNSPDLDASVTAVAQRTRFRGHFGSVLQQIGS